MRVHHIALRTRDLARLERFYAGVLGLAVLRRDGERSVWLDAGGTVLMLEAAEASEPEIATGSKEMFAFAVGGAELVKYKEALAGIVEGSTAFTIYFRDPDGRRVGLSTYPI